MKLSEKSIMGATIEYREAAYKFDKHLHTSMELYLIDQGICYMDIGNRRFSYASGDFVLILPHVVHSFYVDADSKETCIFRHIHVKTEGFEDITLLENEGHLLSLMNALQFSFNNYYTQKADNVVSNCVSRVIELYQKDSRNGIGQAEMNLQLMNLFLHIINQCEEIVRVSENKMQSYYVSMTLQYIQENYMYKIKQSEIAESLHISVRYLAKVFNRYMGITLSNYINVFRINKAIMMMEKTDWSLTEIAMKIGLSSSQHFTKLFTDIINMSPSNYRKKFLKNT